MTDDIELTEGPLGNNFGVGLSNTGKQLVAKLGKTLTKNGSTANAHYQGVEQRIEIVQTIKSEYAKYLAQTKQKATTANLKTFMKSLMNTNIDGILKDYRLVSNPRQTPLSPEVMQKLDQFGDKQKNDFRKEQDADFVRIMNVLNVSYETELAPKTILLLTQKLMKQAGSDATNRERLRIFLDGILAEPEWAKMTAGVAPLAKKLAQPQKKLFASFRESVVEFAATLVEEKCFTGEQVNDLYKVIFEDVFLDAKTLNDIITDVVSGEYEEPRSKAAISAQAAQDEDDAKVATQAQPAQQQQAQPAPAQPAQKAAQPAQQAPAPAQKQGGSVTHAALDMRRLRQSLSDHNLPNMSDEIVRALHQADRSGRDKDKEVIRLATDRRLDPEKVLAAVVAAVK